jgi:deoxyribonuclease IV
MLIGAHVSPAGGLPKAIERGVQRGCKAIQIFNQSPRMWKPTAYSDEDFAAFGEAMAASPIDAVLIHAVYLLNCASDDRDIRAKSIMSLTHSLRVGHAIGASGVVLHPGSAKTGEIGAAITRASETIAEALKESNGCQLHLENTAGAGGTLGRSVEELARLLEGAGADDRLGVCLDSCHLLASGYDIRTGAGMAGVLEDGARVKPRPARQPRRRRAR